MPELANVDEAVKAMSARADSSRLRNMNATVLFDFSADGGGKWTATIDHGQFSIDQTGAPTPDVTIRMKGSDFTAMMNGSLNPVAAFMQGRIRVEGDMGVAMQLQSLFG